MIISNIMERNYEFNFPISSIYVNFEERKKLWDHSYSSFKKKCDTGSRPYTDTNLINYTVYHLDKMIVNFSHGLTQDRINDILSINIGENITKEKHDKILQAVKNELHEPLLYDHEYMISFFSKLSDLLRADSSYINFDIDIVRSIVYDKKMSDKKKMSTYLKIISSFDRFYKLYRCNEEIKHIYRSLHFQKSILYLEKYPKFKTLCKENIIFRDKVYYYHDVIFRIKSCPIYLNTNEKNRFADLVINAFVK
jgi:hypothetical protein